jgi:hypothetical protein
MIKRLLFETKLGEVLLALLESKMHLAVIVVNDLANQRSGCPTARDAA